MSPTRKNTLEIEVTNISSHGFWLFVYGEELFLSYKDFPWFKEQTVSAIKDVEMVSKTHYHWPKLDIDLTRNIIENPDKYPLVAKENKSN